MAAILVAGYTANNSLETQRSYSRRVGTVTPPATAPYRCAATSVAL